MTTVLPERPVVAPSEPRTWSFIAYPSGELLTVTCMDGCTSDHSQDIETPTHPDDIWCQTTSRDVTLPVNEHGTPEEVNVLSWTLNVRPFDKNVAARLPHVCVELMQDCWIEDLDPDAFEHVIGVLEARVTAMRKAHAQLVRTRQAYRTAR